MAPSDGDTALLQPESFPFTKTCIRGAEMH